MRVRRAQARPALSERRTNAAGTRTPPDTCRRRSEDFGAARALQLSARMNHRRVVFTLVLFAACGPSPAAVPDASPPPDAPKIGLASPAGTFAVNGVIDLEVLPAPADALIAELEDATDSPDDPARFLCDRLVAGLPAGTWRAIAEGVVDVVAPYVETELDSIAPHFADGLRSLTAGLGQIAHHAQTIETLAIEPSGLATRTITGVAYGATTIDFASEGMSDAVATTTVTLDVDGNLEFAAHRLDLLYGRLIRLAFDRQVIPNVDFDADNLADALSDLVDCTQLGALFAEKAGIGSASFYAAACDAGMAALAAEVYDRFAAIDTSPFELDVTGTAVGLDDNGDAVMDQIENGLWSGTSSYAGVATPLVNATFTGTR
jgi:hypothetical protein